MKQGLSLQEIAAELERRNNERQDFIISSKDLTVSPDESNSIMLTSKLSADEYIRSGMNELSESQLMTRLGIPAGYHKNTLKTFPHLMEHSVNYLLQQREQPMMIRRLDNTVDAVLSNAYKRIDNYPVAEMIFPIIQEAGVNIQSCHVTDQKMYLKCVSDRLQGDVKVGDPVQMGMVISNSEVGLGFLSVQAMIYRLVCDNGMVTGREYGDGIRMAHRGARQNYGVCYADDTLRVYGRAISMQVRDTVKQLLSPENFQQHLTKMQETTTRQITGDPTLAIKELGKIVGFTKDEGSGIMRHLIKGGDLSQWGLINSLTAYAQEDDLSYDRASDLEKAGGKVLDLSSRQWRTIAEAA